MQKVSVILANLDAIDMDLNQDLEQFITDRMIKKGYRAKEGRYNLLDYFKLRKKIIPSRPRKVYYSKEFRCPDDCEGALNKILSDVKKGENLLPYMSKGTIRASKNDGLLNDWNIHHFHLSEEYEKDTIFIKRSDWLLLAFIQDESLYCLNVYPHKKPHLWSHKELVRIIANNWPELIEENRLKDIKLLSENLDDEVYGELRNANVTVLVDLGEDKVYGFIGGGYASDGSSLEAVRNSDAWFNYIRNIESLIREEQQNFKQQMLPLDPLSLEKSLEVVLLKVTDKELILLEKQRNVILNVKHTDRKIVMYGVHGLLIEELKKNQSMRGLMLSHTYLSRYFFR